MTKMPVAPRRRNPWPMIAGAGALAVIVAVLLFVLLNQRAPLAILPSPSPTPEPTLNAELLSNRLTVMLIGLDSNDSRRAKHKGLNSDTLMVASINADQSELTLVSLPRDTVDVPMPDGTTWTSKVNAIYAEAGGPDAVVGSMSELLQIDIDGYVQIDMGDLVKIVDAVGGVRVNPKAPLADAHLHLDIPAGRQTLDGRTAEGYVRTRVDNDFQRAARQQEVLLQIVRRLISPDRNVDIQAVLDSLFSFETDLQLDQMPTLMELARRAQSADVTTQVLDPDHGFVTFAGDRGDGRGYILEPDVDAMRQFAAKYLTD